MRLIICIFVSLIIFYSCKNDLKYGNDKSNKELTELSKIDEDTTVYSIVEKMPIFNIEKEGSVNSQNNLIKFVYDNIKYKSLSKSEEIVTLIVFSFVVEKDGSVSNFEVTKGAKLVNIDDVISKMPKWIPGEEKGLKRRVKMQIPIRIDWQ